MTTEQLVADLGHALGDGLRSVVLYGSAAVGDFVSGVSGFDILIVAERLGLAELTALAGPLQRWQEAGNPPPQLFTPAELAGSADVFPIEIGDMQQAHRMLFGGDPLTAIRVDPGHFRLELERELKTRLLLLRRTFLAAEREPQRVAHLLITSVSTFLVLLRACLRLYGEKPPAAKRDALAALARRIDFDPRPLALVHDLKLHPDEPYSGNIEALFGEYLRAIETIVAAVDRHLHRGEAQTNFDRSNQTPS